MLLNGVEPLRINCCSQGFPFRHRPVGLWRSGWENPQADWGRKGVALLLCRVWIIIDLHWSCSLYSKLSHNLSSPSSLLVNSSRFAYSSVNQDTRDSDIR